MLETRALPVRITESFMMMAKRGIWAVLPHPHERAGGFLSHLFSEACMRDWDDQNAYGMA